MQAAQSNFAACVLIALRLDRSGDSGCSRPINSTDVYSEVDFIDRAEKTSKSNCD
jgi:hypothetical protein